MSIAAYVTGGIGPDATIEYFITRGLDVGAAIVLPVSTVVDITLEAEDTVILDGEPQ